MFDPNAPGPDPVPYDDAMIRAGTLETMRKANIPEHLIYAYAKTGLILMQDRMSLYPPDSVAEYDAAIQEYFALEAQKKGD